MILLYLVAGLGVAGTVLGILHKLGKLPFKTIEYMHKGIRTFRERPVYVKRWHRIVFPWRRNRKVGSLRTTDAGHPFFVPFLCDVKPLSLRDRTVDVMNVTYKWKNRERYAGGSFVFNVIDMEEYYVAALWGAEDLTKQVTDILNRAFAQALPRVSPKRVSDPLKMKRTMLRYCREDLLELGVYLKQANAYTSGMTTADAIVTAAKERSTQEDRELLVFGNASENGQQLAFEP